MDYPKATLQEYGYHDYRHLKKAFRIFTDLLVAVIIIVLYFPIFIIALQSVNSGAGLSVFTTFSFGSYTSMFADRMFANAVRNTLLVTAIATLISTVLGTLIAVGINSLPAKYRQRILLLNNIPLLNADIVTGISLMLVFSLFLPIFPYFFGLPTLILAHVFFTLPYVILSVIPKLKEMDPFMMDAALDLGVRPYKALLKVVVPAIKAGIFSGMLLAFTMSIDDFAISYFTTGNGFNNLSIWIYGSYGRKNLNPSVYAFSTALTLVTLLILVVINFVNNRKAKKNEKN